MISIQDVHFSYKRQKVFSGLNLDLQAGHIYGLLGANGTGKSTLLRCISGTLFPDSGRIEAFYGEIPAKRRPSFLSDVFLVPEEFHLPNISIEHYVRYNAPFYPAFNREEFDAHLKAFELSGEHKLGEMSYGQKKKVLISFGLACNTRLLLMDEPSNGLDITSKNQFRKIIAGAVHDERCLLISTHQVKDLDHLIDRLLVIEGGQLLLNRSMSELSRALRFKLSFDPEETAYALYKEESLNGHAIVSLNEEQQEGPCDLELLYRAIVTNREALLSALNRFEMA